MADTPALYESQGRPQAGPRSTDRTRAWGRGFLVASIILFAAVTVPVIVNGAPLLGDFSRCITTDKPGYWHDYYARKGLFRPSSAASIFLINSLCGEVPFALIILLPWVLTIAVALLTRGFLKDIGVVSPWREIGAGLWLLAPLGTETALWPSALRVALGLGLALLALRSFSRGGVVLGSFLGLLAYVSIEQAIFALPLAAWLVSPRDKRVRALVSTVALSGAILLMYALSHGESPRYAVSLSQRLANVFLNPQQYVIMPATGLGAQSIPAAVVWSFPVGLIVLALGGAAGWRIGPKLLKGPFTKGTSARDAFVAVALLILINIPLALVAAHPDSPRVFAPTWLALVVFAAIVGSRARWRRPRPAGAVAGVLISAALLSLALSSWVRIETSHRVEDGMKKIAAVAPDGAIVAVCGWRRTLVEPAPTGAFSIHEFINFSGPAYEYYTGEAAEIRVSPTSTQSRCPQAEGADVVFDLADLVGP